jgi:hypothetical protein
LSIVDSIENLLIPDYYTNSLGGLAPIELLLMKKKAFARYVLVVKSLSDISNLASEIAEVRSQIRKRTNALWMVREVGAYVVFRVDKLPKLERVAIEVDKTGFHAVIIQGVHFISASGQHLFNHSKWLNHTFGGAVGIAERIESIET